MSEELVRRTYSETTIRSYLHAVEASPQHVGKRLSHLGPDDLRRYQVYLLENKPEAAEGWMARGATSSARRGPSKAAQFDISSGVRLYSRMRSVRGPYRV